MDRKVSVIIPNYNYARFLQRRIDSIVNQTIKPDEIIFLDDCSIDNSLGVAEEILYKTDIPYRIIPNEVNQGVFKQWLKGIELTQHDYFWIAEADDYCELNFLETLLPAFDDEDVVISYCQSLRISGSGMENTHKNWLSTEFDAHRWSSDSINNCYDEASKYLVVISSIANASAVLLKKSSINKSWSSLVAQYKMAGDWFFYLLLLFNNPTKKISYNAKVLNYWFQHGSSVWADKGKELLGATECLQVFSFCLMNFKIPTSSRQKILNIMTSHYLNSINDDQMYVHKVLEVVLLLSDDMHSDIIKDFVINRLRINTEINRLHVECANRDGEINRLHVECANQDSEISRLHVECANRESEISRLGIDLSNMNDRLLALDNQLSSEKNEVRRLHSEIHLRDNEINRLHNHIHSIYGSLSWKITKPIRLLKKIIKKILLIPKKIVVKIKQLIKKIVLTIVKKVASIDFIKRIGKSYLNGHPELKIQIKRKMVEKGLLHDPYMQQQNITVTRNADTDLSVEQVRQQYGSDVANVYRILTKKK